MDPKQVAAALGTIPEPPPAMAYEKQDHQPTNRGGERIHEHHHNHQNHEHHDHNHQNHEHHHQNHEHNRQPHQHHAHGQPKQTQPPPAKQKSWLGPFARCFQFGSKSGETRRRCSCDCFGDCCDCCE
ncbi:hypothetical protein Dda_6233 [Drechslerella dactyloides]|uniref:Uncharacterized protein n=1 Tax=Drechslerella dactyloides TaxID=74499 RepID=A0AAD6IVF7_DREDA|nr:hypothetical protein Dda_6233 [Drechslerella dactyloides]